MELFTKNFSYDELIASSTAKRLNIDNTPIPEYKDNLRRLAEDVLQPIRDAWRAPVVVNSGYRSIELNKAIGGVSNSQHLTGEAADIRPNKMTEGGKLYRMIEHMVKSGKLTLGQCIWEYGNSKNPQWIHVSLPTSKHKNEFFRVK